MFRVNTLPGLYPTSTVDEKTQNPSNASSTSGMRIGPPGPETAGNTSEKKIAYIGSRPAFLTDQAMVEAIPRTSIPPSLPKPYQGFNRICQSLRHIATAVNWGMIESMSLRPIEVQASIINGKLHISSNFHHEHIAKALHFSLAKDSDKSMPYTGARRSKALVEEARNRRHIAKLKDDFQSQARFDALKEKIVAEIAKGLGDTAHTNLTHEEVASQAITALNVLRYVIKEASLPNPTFENVVIHAPFSDENLDGALPEGIKQTMHAEQNIQRALANDQDSQYQHAMAKLGLQEGKHVIIPIAGKFVPCAACSEVEHEAKSSEGLFDPQRGKFVLHRSSQRIGMAFWDEVQHIAVETLDVDQEKALQKGIALRDRFYEHPEKLQAAHREMVEDFSFDTDSACSDDD